LRIVIADDHAIVREGVIYALKSHFGKETEVLEAEDSVSLMTLLGKHKTIDLILLDLMMPGSRGLSLLKKIGSKWPKYTVVILSASEDAKQMRKSIDLGAGGFIPKSLPREIMMNAIRLVLAGGVYVPPKSLLSVEGDTSYTKGIKNKQLLGSEISTAKLTDRQKQVLIGIARGKTNKDIGDGLELSEYTIKIHVTAIFKKLQVNNRMQSVLAAQELGLFEPGDIET